MEKVMYWIILILILILGAMAVAFTVLITHGRESDSANASVTSYWHVELWNISQGYQVELRFINTFVFGRMSLYENITAGWPMEMDATISREHCLLYEQNGMLLAWNMSAINPAVINGYRILQPVHLMQGDRMELGNSVFLVTRAERI